MKFTSKEDALRDLKSQYLKPSKPLSFAGISAILRYYKGSKLNEKDVRKFLSTQRVYTRTREFHQPLQRNPVFCYGARDLVEIDLIQMPPKIAKLNKNTYILVCLDVFTRYMWAEFVPTKSWQHIVPTFENLLHQMMEGPSGKTPRTILADRGLEFTNKRFKALLEKHNIKLVHNFTSYKASHVERAQRTLQRRIYSWVEASGSMVFYTKLQDFVSAYNSSYHRGIKM